MTLPFERKTILELKARYELEPDLEDFYVEGRFDQEVLSKYFHDNSHKNKIVYEIESVHLPIDLLASNGFTDGKKQRVITLARELAKSLPNKCSYRCVADRDFDHWLSRLENTLRLVWTEFTSIELYFFTDELMREILINCACAKIKKWDSFIKSFSFTLQKLYAIRLTERKLKWSMDYLTFDRCLMIKDDNIEFNDKEFIKRLLLKNNLNTEISEFEFSLEETWKSILAEDFRRSICGHDFIKLIAWSIRKLGGLKEFSTPVAIERIFILLAREAKHISNLSS